MNFSQHNQNFIDRLNDLYSDIKDVSIHCFGFNLTKTQSVGVRKYFSNLGEFRWSTYSEEGRIYFEDAIKRQILSNKDPFSNTYAFSRMSNIPSFYVDLDSDHIKTTDSLSKTQLDPKEGKRIIKEIAELCGKTSNYVELKKTGNAHSVFNTDKPMNKRQLQALQIYLRKYIDKKIELIYGDTVVRLPDSNSYTPVNPENLDEEWNNLEWVSYCKDKMNSNLVDVDALMKKIGYQEPKAKTSGPKITQKYFSGEVSENFIDFDDVDFEAGNSWEQIQKTGFARFVHCNMDKDQLAQHLYDRRGDCKRFESMSECNQTAAYIEKSFNIDKYLAGSKKSTVQTITEPKKPKVHLSHLERLTDENIQGIKEIVSVLNSNNYFSYSKYKKVRIKQNVMIEEILKYIISSHDYQNETIIPNKKLSDKFVETAAAANIPNANLAIIKEGVTFNIPFIVKYIESLGLGGRRASEPIIREVIKLLEDTKLHIKVLNHRYIPRNTLRNIPQVSYQRQYKTKFHNMLAFLSKIKTIIFNFIKGLRKSLINNSIKERTKYIYSTFLSNDNDEKSINKGLPRAPGSDMEHVKTNQTDNKSFYNSLRAKILQTKAGSRADDIIINFEVEYEVPEERIQYKREEPVWSLACDRNEEIKKG